jgi:hypothetical protein
MISEDFLVRRIQEPMPAGAPIVPVSFPVTSFGSPQRAHVATIGINPSSSEFHSKGSIPLAPEKKRFVDREVIGLAPHAVPNDEQARRILEGNHNYFTTGNAYKWFDAMQAWVLDPLGVSYANGSAAHLDLVQWATDPVWDRIDDAGAKSALLEKDREFLRDLLGHGEFRLIVLNGATVLKSLRETGLFSPSETEKVSFVTPSGRNMSVKFTVGTVHDIPAIGWSANIPDSHCGNKTRQVVSDWIASTARGGKFDLPLRSVSELRDRRW